MEIKKVCIVGMGTMGSQIGIVSASGGYKTSMVDTSDEKVAAGLKTVHFFLENRVKKGKLGRRRGMRFLPLSQPKWIWQKHAGTQISDRGCT